MTDLKACVPTIHISPQHKPFSPKPRHLVQKCDDLLGGKPQRKTLKFSLNHHPSRHKERPMDGSLCPCTPRPGLEHTPPPAVSHQAARHRGSWRRAEGKVGFTCARQYQVSCLHLQALDPPKRILLQANAVVIPILRGRKLRLEGGFCLVFIWKWVIWD